MVLSILALAEGLIILVAAKKQNERYFQLKKSKENK